MDPCRPADRDPPGNAARSRTCHRRRGSASRCVRVTGPARGLTLPPALAPELVNIEVDETSLAPKRGNIARRSTASGLPATFCQSALGEELTINRVGYGTMKLSGWPRGEAPARDTALTILRRAVDLGVTTSTRPTTTPATAWPRTNSSVPGCTPHPRRSRHPDQGRRAGRRPRHRPVPRRAVRFHARWAAGDAESREARAAMRTSARSVPTCHIAVTAGASRPWRSQREAALAARGCARGPRFRGRRRPRCGSRGQRRPRSAPTNELGGRRVVVVIVLRPGERDGDGVVEGVPEPAERTRTDRDDQDRPGHPGAPSVRSPPVSRSARSRRRAGRSGHPGQPSVRPAERVKERRQGGTESRKASIEDRVGAVGAARGRSAAARCRQRRPPPGRARRERRRSLRPGSGRSRRRIRPSR